MLFAEMMRLVGHGNHSCVGSFTAMSAHSTSQNVPWDCDHSQLPKTLTTKLPTTPQAMCPPMPYMQGVLDLTCTSLKLNSRPQANGACLESTSTACTRQRNVGFDIPCPVRLCRPNWPSVCHVHKGTSNRRQPPGREFSSGPSLSHQRLWV